MSISSFRLRESAAVARQGLLIARRWVRRDERDLPDDEPHVLFVHGYLAGGAVFDPLRSHLESRVDHATLDFEYGPHRAFESVAEELGERVEQVGRSHPVVLVGHSLGGLLARWFVEELGGASKVRRLITLATPHAGTERARVAPGSLGAALRPGSAVLRRLGDQSSIPMLSVAGGADHVVSIASASAVRNARFRVVPGVGHNELLYDRRTYEAVVDAVRDPGDAAVAAE
ncbi:MAG: alpha/beta fold hydrolase [Sandaracinus sp.]|nr:alpha/beta fold hydrolase [Myxococcales bacterium]MCB9618389.1 alpha/beta fold hydrolase [Sandaracinus sp.]MCB9634823.1 alpha/beta fold hydrolase [Sandaracinus sp.]